MAKDFINEMFFGKLIDFFKEKLEEGLPKEKIQDFLDSSEIGELYAEIVKTVSDSAAETIEEIMFEKVLVERAFDNEFLARVEQKWGKAFVASEALYLCVMESSDEYIKFISEEMKGKNSDKAPIFNALMRIHARACQEYLEILCLCKNGFADGAYARWRSLYELSIISDFIRKNDKKVAISFLNAANSDDRYEWARCAKCFKKYPPNRFITFSAIQKQCTLSTTDWRKQYDLSNQLVHASPQGTMYRLGNKADTGFLSAGRSDYGMSSPLINSANCLVLITSDLFTIFNHGDSLVAMMAFSKWLRKISDYCDEIEKECFS